MSAASASMTSSLLGLARSKLHSAVGGSVKDSCSLHRWVLLKNSMIRSHPLDVAPAASDKADVPYVCSRQEDERTEDEDEEVAFMFPDPDALSSPGAGPSDSENEWLDSLLESLGGEDELEGDEALSVSALSPDDDDEPLSPLYSPMSSSDDLVDDTSYFCNPHAIPIPYPVPYPPLPSHMPTWLDVEPSADSLLDSSLPLYQDPLPYFDLDDTEDLPVPDAIEDTSDDESDAPLTPFDHSTSSLDPASIPLPPDRRRPRSLPQVYVDMDDAYFYPFELDPSPTHDDSPIDTARVLRPSLYQEC
ncbi:hypothetical protein WOLCODRAFT_136172 [Wolfiporia cocos MD-104 SS10]|uniref:Uncharacterized protein n=1 Tax=Wolfiporia cocos (strain MD-104) TaxID=742152 RepID=A0A2H3J7X6_WOLCO|nr:hypothetical protein WOLCODRAFT_136172 [Wolfiporia cocos MD-104 SS10]